MSNTHETAASGPVTYGLGIAAVTVSQMTINDWLIALSIVLVIMRIVFEAHDFLQRRADKKAEIAERKAKLAADAKTACELNPVE